MREKNRKFPIHSPLWAAGPGQDLVLDFRKIGPQGLAHLFVKFGSILGLNELSLNLDLVIWTYIYGSEWVGRVASNSNNFSKLCHLIWSEAILYCRVAPKTTLD